MTQHAPPLSRAWRNLLAVACTLAWSSTFAQRTFHWVGGDGAWQDATHWSLRPDGIGGAGIPGRADAVVLTASQPTTITVDGNVRCGMLTMDGTHAAVQLRGEGGASLDIAGSLDLRGDVHLVLPGGLGFTGRAEDAFIDTRGIILDTDILIDGPGAWSVRSDLTLRGVHALVVREGLVRTHTNILRLGALRFEGRAPKTFDAGTSAVFCSGAYVRGSVPMQFITDDAELFVAGERRPWAEGDDTAGVARGTSICGTGNGQTPFSIDANAPSNFNGFDISCNGACDGQVTVTVSGGIGPFLYQWQTGPNTQTWNNTCVGNKLVIVTDQGQGVGCAATVQVVGPAPLGVIFFPPLTPPTCADVCNGTGSALAVGGTGSGYTYNWNNGAGTNAFFGQLCSGPNSLIIEDNNNCQFDTTFSIDLQPITPVLTPQNPTCNGDCNGSASVSVTGGTGQLTFNWEPGNPPGDGTNAVSGLCAGAYSLVITDVNGCDTTLQFTLTQPSPILPNETATNATCANACDGTATVNPAGSTGPYTYAWSGGVGGGQGTPTATGLCPGTYQCLITDVPSGCDTLVIITISSPQPIDPFPGSTNVTCNGDCDGSATVAPVGGSGQFDFLWSPLPPAGQFTPGASQLCAGTWSVTITDIAGCDTTVTFDITEPDPILPNEVVTPITCPGACDGVIGCGPTGGTGAYTYSWAPAPPSGQGTSTASGLCAGTWSVTITDAAGCDTTLTVVLAEPVPLSAVPTQTNISCGTACDGAASVVVSGGNDPYTYQWSPAPGGGQGTANATDLCAGPITVTITDSVGCQLVTPFTILPAPPLNVVLTLANATCSDLCDGSASAVIGGGYPPYDLQWTPAPAGGQGTTVATGLCAQDYTLTVTDSAGCDTSITFTITAPQPIEPNPTVQNVNCFGACDGSIVLAPTGGSGTYTYLWSPVPPNAQGTPAATGLCAGNWQVTVSDGTCDTVLVFTITEPPALVPVLTLEQVTCADACNGTASVNVTGGVPDYAYAWSPAPGGGQGTPNATGLCAGAYTLLVTDDAGCDSLLSFSIAAPAPLLPQITTTPANCGGDCNGTATVSWTGGSGPVDIVWSPEPGNGQGTQTATDMCPGVWSVTLTDSLGCDTTLQLIITTPSGIQATPTVFDASCFDLCDGAIDLVVTGGLPTYTFSWTPAPPGGSGTNITDLCPGQWTVQISDLAGCDTVLVMTVNAPSAILPNGSFTNETCNGPCDGTATVQPAGGAGGYAYAWSPNPPVGQGTNAVSGLCAGTWSVTITDAAGCDTVWTFTVLPEQPIDAGLVKYDSPCPGTCGGAAAVSPTGGSPGYTYQWMPQPPIGQGTDTVSGLCLGQWSVIITDAAGCDTTLDFIIDKPLPIQLSLGVAAANCNDACSGEAAIFPVGGTPGYSVLWQPPPPTGQGTYAVSGLCAGTTYSVTVTDTAGCDTTQSFTVLPFQPITTGITPEDASCGNLCDGSAVLDLFGGEAPYTFDWSPDPGSGDSTQTPGALCAGDYTVVITDNNGCDTTAQVTIGAPAAIDVAPVVSPVVCSGACDASIDLNATGGGGPLTFTWTPAPPVGQGTGTVAQLCAGVWTVAISDGSGCDTVITFQLDDPAPLLVSPVVTPSNCQQCIGEVELQATGGGGGYTFTWGAPLNVTTTDPLLTGLCAGVYQVTVADLLGCEQVLAVPVTDSQGEVILASDDEVTCPSDCDGSVTVSYNCSVPVCTATWYDASGAVLLAGSDTLTGLCAGIYIVGVSNGDGCLSIDTAQVIVPDPLQVQFTTQPTSCAGVCDGSAALGISGGAAPYIISWSPAPPQGQGTPQVSGLCPGVYTATVTDANGCTVSVDVLIIGASPITLAAQVANVTCAGACDGSIAVQPGGGSGVLTIVWSPVPPNGPNALLTGPLCPGAYDLLLVDAQGCDTTVSFVITAPAPLVVSATATLSHCQVCDGTASLDITGGTPQVNVIWSDGAGAVVGNGPQVTGLCAGIYSADLVDANGCATSITVPIGDATGETLTVSNGQTSCNNTCDGEVAVSFNCTDGPCTIQWFDQQGTILAGNQFTLTDLCVGEYYVSVTNGAGCTVVDTASVVPSQVITVAFTTSPVTCNGLCDGVAAVLASGGTAPYTYDWSPDPPVGDSTAQASGLCPGVWNVLITDSAGCDTTIAVLILEPAAVQASISGADVTCNGACDGTATVIATGGTGPFSYAWSPVPPDGQGTSTASVLCPGDWSVTVADSLGCAVTLQQIISEPLALTLSTLTTQSTCGVCNGTATAIPTGGTAPYLYAWTANGGVLGTDSLQGGLCAGFIDLLVTDANGCQVQATVAISDLDGEVLSITNDLVTCPGFCDGTVSVAFNCAEPTCTIAWYDVGGVDLGQSGDSLTGLCAGTYYVAVTNGIGCITIDTAIVAEPQPIQPNLGTTPESCAGSCDGTAVVSPSGGVAPYTYDWSPDPVQGDSTVQVSGLCPGGYTVLITDSIGCSITQDVLILGPSPLSVLAVVDSISCAGVCDGSITVQASGGTGAYTYTWDPVPPNGQGDSLATDLCAGTWTVTVTDANGCNTAFVYVLGDPQLLDVTMTVSDNLCFGDCIGQAVADVTGGTGGYTTTWTDAVGTVIAQGDTILGGLCAGDYVFTAIDANGCESQRPFTVGQGLPIVPGLVFLGETCNGPCDGTAGVNPAGGAGGYDYAWLDAGGNVFAAGQPQVTGLCAGNWTVVITDSLGCDTLVPFTILPYTPISPNAVISDVLCNGQCNGSITLAPTGGIGIYGYDWEPFPPGGDGNPVASGLCPGVWSVTVTDAVGCDTTFSFTLSDPPALSIQVDGITPAACNTSADGAIQVSASGGTGQLLFGWTGPGGFTSDQEDLSDLAPGDYLLTVTDGNGCALQQGVTVPALNSVLADAGPDITQCAGPSIILNASASQGATSFAWTDGQGAPLGQGVTLDLGALQPGAYTVVLTATSGPCSDQDTVLINILALPVADAGPDQSILIGATVTLAGVPGPPGSTYLWSPDSLVSSPTVLDPTASPDVTTWFVLQVTTDAGCSDVDSVLITVVPEIVIPTGFSPNSDGHNDAWQIDNIALFPDCRVEIYSRWGELLFTSDGYPVPWDGTYNGGLVPVGTYYYAIELNDPRFPEPYTGPLTVIR